MKYKLMIKQHNVTNLKYLCMTSKEDYEKYSGSGTKWKNHLKKHGCDINTQLIYQSDDYSHFVEVCRYISEDLNVVLNEEFANLIPESGYGEGETQNFVLWWKYASEEQKMSVIERRKIKQLENHWVKKSNNAIIRAKISESRIEHWENLNVDERRNYMENFHQGRKNFFENTESEKYMSWRKSLINSHDDYFANIDPKILSDRNTKSRLSLTDEQKQIRKQKIQNVYATGKHNEYFKRLSEERTGIKNPGAKLIEWNFEIYTKTGFLKFIKDNNIKKEYAFSVLEMCNDGFKKLYDDTPKVYEIITCTYCDKKSNGNNPSGFKRWHFENCKRKNK